MPPVDGVHDEHHGMSGSYTIGADGKRVLVEGSRTEPHPEGDAPRDEHGERTDRGADHQAAAAPQSALPEPAKTPPWAVPAADAAVTESSRKRARSDNN